MVDIPIPLFGGRGKPRIRRSVGTYTSMAKKPVLVIIIPYAIVLVFTAYLREIVFYSSNVVLNPPLLIFAQYGTYMGGLGLVMVSFTVLRAAHAQAASATDKWDVTLRWNETDWQELHVSSDGVFVPIATAPDLTPQGMIQKIAEGYRIVEGLQRDAGVTRAVPSNLGGGWGGMAFGKPPIEEDELVRKDEELKRKKKEEVIQ